MANDDDPMHWATMPVPLGEGGEARFAFYDRLPVAELRGLWHVLHATRYRDHTRALFDAAAYFDHLPHRDPARAVALAREISARETDERVVALLADKFLMALIHAHGPLVVAALESAAREDRRFAQLLGGVLWSIQDEQVATRLRAVADTAGWRRERERHESAPRAPRLAGLPIERLAALWVEENDKPPKDRDGLHRALADYQTELVAEEPDRALDLVVAVMAIERDPLLLGLLAAAVLEAVIADGTIARIERQARADRRFHALIAECWYSGLPERLRARLDRLVETIPVEEP